MRGRKFTPKKMRVLKILLKKLRGLNFFSIFPKEHSVRLFPTKMFAPYGFGPYIAVG